VNIFSTFQLSSSYGLGKKVYWCIGTKGWKNQSINELMSNEAVYRTAPATPGLLKIKHRKFYCKIFDVKDECEWHRKSWAKKLLDSGVSVMVIFPKAVQYFSLWALSLTNKLELFTHCGHDDMNMEED